MKKLLTICLLFSVLFSFGQEEKKKLTDMNYSQFLASIENGDYRFVNKKIKVGGHNSEDSLCWKIQYYYIPELNDTLPEIWLYKQIENQVFNKFLHITDSEVQIQFENCTFNRGVYFENSSGNIRFINCEFFGDKPNRYNEEGYIVDGSGVAFDDCKVKRLDFKGCSFNNINGFSFGGGTAKSISIDNCSFKLNSNQYGDDSWLESISISFSSIDNFNITGCEAEAIPRVQGSILNVVETNIKSLTLMNSKIASIGFDGVNIKDKIDIDYLITNSYAFNDFYFPEGEASMSWSNFKGNKIHIINNYNATHDTIVHDGYLFRKFLKFYNNLFHMYKDQGDLESANGCYVEMKDLETRRLKYLEETQGGSKNYLNYQLNVFLKFFAEYGTSPIRSIQISGWVILIFSFFYFFFYSAWDKINRKFLIDRGEKLLSYFNSEQKLEDLYSDKHKEDLSTYTQFKQNLKESKAQVPFFFMLFLKPLYWVAVIKLKGNKALYKRIEFLQGRWVDLSTGKKFVIGSFTFLTILTYGVYLIAIRSLNSLILSINTFTTLGFGDIPVVGISRYVAILEGFLGWFLLSIFSVSLISQILQN